MEGGAFPVLRQRRLDAAVPDPALRAVPLDGRPRRGGRPARAGDERAGLDPGAGRPGRRRLHRVPPALHERPRVPVLEGLVGLDAIPRRPGRAHADRDRRGAGLRVRRPRTNGRAGAATSGATSRWPPSWRPRRRRSRQRFNDDFFLEGEGGGHYVLGLDHAKQPIDSLCSNIGHLLWSGIVDEPRAGPDRRAADVAQPQLRLGRPHHVRPGARLQPDRLPHRHRLAARQQPGDGRPAAATATASTPTGSRPRCSRRRATSSTACRRYSPATRAKRRPFPVAYPTACSPQAWAAGAPVLFLRSMLGLRPDPETGKLHADAVLPEACTPAGAARRGGAGPAVRHHRARRPRRGAGERVEVLQRRPPSPNTGRVNHREREGRNGRMGRCLRCGPSTCRR